VNPLIASIADFWHVLRTPYVSDESRRRLQDARLRRVVTHAARHVPYYRDLFQIHQIDPSSIRSTDDLVRIPVTTKRDLLAAGSDALSTAFRGHELIDHRTSGSSGEPATLWFDRRFERTRSLLFLRALFATGYRPGDRLLMMKSTHRDRARRWMRWEAIPFDMKPQNVIDRIERDGVRILYGWATPLSAIAEEALKGGRRPGALKAVICTAETLQPATRRLLEDAFAAPVFDFYGLTEMGTVAWECRHHNGYHVSEDGVLLELVPSDTGDSERRMILTNLVLTSMPLLRFQCGDMAVEAAPGICACGRTLRRLQRISGREVDCLRLPDGRRVSPYTVTLALEPVRDLRRYQVVQRSRDHLVVRGEGDFAEPAVRAALVAVVGGDMKIEVMREQRVQVSAGRKFRVVDAQGLLGE
jgi:phenylacetate-CoA ligase